MGNGVDADPEELKKFAGRLRSFNQVAGNNVDLLKTQFKQLGESWRDEEYRKFEVEFTQTMKTVKNFFTACENYEVYLRTKAEPLIDYKNRHIK